MAAEYKYKPEIPEVFRCRVPLPGTSQAFVLNGVLRDSYDNGSGMRLSSSPKGYQLTVDPNSESTDNMQIISVRDKFVSDPLFAENKIVFGKSSSASILLCTHTLSLDNFDTRESLNIETHEGAKAEIVVMQNENNTSAHTTEFVLHVGKGSKLKITIVTLHGAQIKNIIKSHINGEGASCELNGLCLADGNQEMSSTIEMFHHAPGCHSSQLFKGILDESSRSLFSGKIIVDRDSQKTEAYQANHNLLLSKSAKAFVQPQLVIYADDVKCSHGATSGRLDENALFYMRSRGIGKDEAKLLQQLAFVNDVLEAISNSHLKKRLEELVESRLRGEFSHCANCSVNCC